MGVKYFKFPDITPTPTLPLERGRELQIFEIEVTK